MGLFNKKYFQNYDSNGQPTTKVELTDANCIFVHSLYGNDINNGSRANPVKTITRAITISTTYICAIGVFNENPNFNVSRILFSDSDVRIIINGVISGSLISDFRDIVSTGATSPTNNFGSVFLNSIINNYSGNNGRISGAAIAVNQRINGNVFQTLNIAGNGIFMGGHTVGTLNVNTAMSRTYSSCIVINEINLQSTSVNYTFSYYLYRKSVIWKFKNTVIPVTYNGDSSSYMNDLRNSITAYANTLADGTDKTWLLNFAINGFVKTESGLDTCVIHDDILGVKIFNRYSNNIPVDYTLNVHPDNPALTMAINGLHVGAYKPTISAFTYESIQDIDSNGSPTANTANMLVVSGKVITVDNTYDTQFWNRATSGIVALSRGLSFDGLLSDYRSGLTKGFYFGKKKFLSGTNSPRETVEIMPYDDATTPSTFPKFSASLNGTTKIFHLASDNSPLLYNQLSTYGYTSDVDLAIYGNYAVTDADSIIYQDIEADLRFVKRDINVRYCKIELNLHYSA